MFFYPHARIYANGFLGLKIVPWKNRHREAVGTCFYLNKHGSKKILWKRRLVIYPQDVMFSGNYVITLDTLYSSQQEHAIVIYGPEGQVITDLALSDFLSEQEIEEFAVDPDSFDWLNWRKNAELSFRKHLSMELHIRFCWGKIIGISLATGYMIQYWPIEPIVSHDWSLPTRKSSSISVESDWLPKDTGKYGIYSEKHFHTDPRQ